MIHSLLFDLDGTLSDPKEGITQSIRYALTELEIDAPDAKDLEWCIGPPLQSSFLKLLKGDRVLAENALSLYRERYKKLGMYENLVYPDIPEVLAAFKASPKRLFVATSKPFIFAKEILTHFGMVDFFDGIYGSELDGTRSDKKELIQYILDRESIKTEEARMIGDREHDIFGARACNVVPVAVLWGYGTRQELKEAGAELFCDRPFDLVEAVNVTLPAP